MSAINIMRKYLSDLLELPFTPNHPILYDINDKNMFDEKIQTSSDIFELLDFTKPEFRLRFIKLLSYDIDILLNDCGNLLVHSLNLVTSFAHNINISKDTFFHWVCNADKNVVMSKNEIHILDTFDDEVTIYRGSTNPDKHGIAWCLNKTNDKKYADKVNGKIFEAKISPENIFVYKEDVDTLLVHFRKLTNLKEI